MPPCECPWVAKPEPWLESNISEKNLKTSIHQWSPFNLTDLERICRDEWLKIPKSRCAELVASHRKGLEAVIAAKAASSKYSVKSQNTYPSIRNTAYPFRVVEVLHTVKPQVNRGLNPEHSGCEATVLSTAPPGHRLNTWANVIFQFFPLNMFNLNLEILNFILMELRL